MNKLELVATVLNAELKEPDLTDDQRKAKIGEAVRMFAADMLNLNQMLRDKNLEAEASREIMEQQGLDYSGKTRKFS